MMSDGSNGSEWIALCGIFVVFHLIAVPPFVWAMRNRQFSGREQREWSLEDPEAPTVPPALTPLNPHRARWMLGILAVMAALTLSSIVITLLLAMSAPAHPVAGKCPF